MAAHAVRVAVVADPLLDGAPHDYADAFEIRLDRPDAHSAEEWVRQGLEQSAPAVRGLIRFVHGRVARFELVNGPDTVLGWRVVESRPDVVHLQTSGPLLRADIIARRTSPTVAGFTTFLIYRNRATPLLWKAIGPLHRAIAPYLLKRAAATLTRAAVA